MPYRQLESGESDLAELVARFGDARSPRAVAVAAAFLLSFYVGLALAYRDAIPLFEAPDEPSHLHYAAFVYTHGRLPRQEPLEVPGEGMQPPLVYLVAAPLLGGAALDVAWAADQLGSVASPHYTGPKPSAPQRSLSAYEHGYRQFVTDGSLESLRIVRTTSLAFGLLAVIFAFAAVWRISRDARLALLAASLLAFDPQFLFSSGYFSNDPAAAAVGAAALWVVVRALEDPQRGPSRGHYLGGALLVAFGVLSKLSTLPGLAVAAATVVAVDRRALRAKLLDIALAAAIVALLCGPYVVWSAEHRGGFLGTDAIVASAVGMLRADHFGGLVPYLTNVYWDWTFESYWARFGWFNVAAPKAVYLAFFAITWSGVLGFAAGRTPLPFDALRSRALRLYLIAAIGVMLAAHFAMNLAIVNPQGRHLFASAPQIALLLALGLYRLIGSERRMLALSISVVALLVALDVWCLRGVLVPAYWEGP